MPMSILDSRLKFMNRLLDSPKTEAKGVIIVRGSWDGTLGSLGLPFDIDRCV